MDIPITSVKPIFHPSSSTTPLPIQIQIQIHPNNHPNPPSPTSPRRRLLRRNRPSPAPHPQSPQQRPKRHPLPLLNNLLPSHPRLPNLLLPPKPQPHDSQPPPRPGAVRHYPRGFGDRQWHCACYFVRGRSGSRQGGEDAVGCGGGKYKACYLLPDDPSESGEGDSEGLLITETVVPGFEFEDHEFLSPQTMERLLPEEQCRALSWMIKKDG
ncbi:uncharacterized protein P174DRAFT_439242 [Aspergillus novofumigatus IBT 16806]|uniref:DUF985 domain-containing protein n=1 Tax=Aspergillus novofumigatus (strain IBT 16806) TaxID=1392255 RepID=A0A2I1CIK4_ASPN1|nr:uncharacterized protein P174DRAFT_439242 [Aspergillus novofumigatus IBT 16806]PKX97468.1 hypothetical protein P174DRAFT_439242 [Aspergillus novofumigatus IBT 16806]